MSFQPLTEFGLSLLQQSDVRESVVISPVSIAIAIAMVHSGAEGTSKEEIRKVIAEGCTHAQLLEYYKTVGEALLKKSEVVVKLANRMFIRDNYELKQTYLDQIEKNFAAMAVNLDFRNKEASSMAVNGFVEEVTEGKIKDLVKPDEFNEDVTALLINAIYFAGDWQRAFPEDSPLRDFHIKEGVSKQVPFMTHTGVHEGYVATDEVQVLSLNYKDTNFKFTIVLPKEKFGLATFRDGLSAEKLLDLLSRVHEHYLLISIPKFKIEKETPLTNALKILGINKIFTDDAELQGIADDIKVSDVKHKAFIEVDEKGTKAAAATVVKMSKKKCARKVPEKIKFCADHPFLFFISHEKNIVFCGQYNA